VPLTDARLLAQHADGVILICRAGETSIEQLASVRKCFSHDGTHVIGTILNGWNVHAEDPSYLQSYVSYYGNASTK
jgi:polysaccharide biosynthesis transport protein